MANRKIITAFDNQDGMVIIYRENGKKKSDIIDVDWYFFIKLSDYNKAKIILSDYRKIIKKILKNGEYVKVYIDMPFQHDTNIDNLRKHLENNQIEVFEYDLNKTKRKMIDDFMEIETDLKILYFDIETDDSKGGISIGRDTIISWAGLNNENKVFYESGDEKEILKKFLKVIDHYDIITGWNSEEFDLPYIKIRCDKYGLKYDWRKIIHIDMLQRCFKIYGYEANIIGLKNFSLNEISRCFLGKQKIVTDKKIHEMVKNYPELLKQYNIQDASLLKDLDNKLGIINVMVMECALTGSFLYKFYIGELLDNYILREAKKQGKILKSKPSKETQETRKFIHIVGGYVKDPIPGLYKHVNICDFKSMYPSIIVGWNIGQDSLNEELSKKGYDNLITFLNGRKIEDVSFNEWDEFLRKEKKELDPENLHIQSSNNSFFKRNVNSFIGELVMKLLDQRKEYKKKLKELTFDTPEYNNVYATERVVKEMANSMFGITCDKNSRYFNQYVSEAITYTGQWLNKLSSKVAESLELTSIYGDTDSIFIIGVDDLSDKIQKINDGLNKFLNENIGLIKNIVSIDYEKHYSKLLLLDKKRYTGILSMKDGKIINKLFSRGTEDVKKSNTQLGKKIFIDFVNKLFDDSFSKENAIEYIRDLNIQLQSNDFSPEDLLITTRVSKSISNYKVMSVHSRLAKRLIESGDLLPIIEGDKKIGTRLEYIMIDKDEKNEGVLLSEYQGNFNREYYWKIQVYAPLRRVLECVYPQDDWHEYDEFSLLFVKPKQLSLF